MSMKNFLLVMGAAALLAGCGSAVRLDNPPVEERSTGATGPGGGSVVAKGEVLPVEVGKTEQQEAIPTGSRLVYFDYDSYVIKPEYQPLVETHAAFIKSDRARKVVIEGHTDERGGREYNLALGQKRAEALRRAMGLLGVADNQMEAVSFGKEKPAVQGNDEAAWAKNRRTEISYR